MSENFILPKQLRSEGYICRDSSNNECDLPEYCTGDSGQCPPDVYKKNGSPCGVGASGMEKATGKQYLSLSFVVGLYYNDRIS